MQHLKWSPREKKIARGAFDETIDSTLSQIIADFKAKAAAVVTSDDMWALEGYLRRKRREVEETFDYRYSQLPLVFARLISEGYMDEAQLSGLSDDKLATIRRILSWRDSAA